MTQSPDGDDPPRPLLAQQQPSVPPPPPVPPPPYAPQPPYGQQPYPQSPYGPAVAPPAGPPTSGMAVASLVLGIVGVLGGWCTFAVPCVLAVIFGYVGLGQTKGGARSGRGMAIAGLVLGLIPTAVIMLILVFGGIGALLAPVSSMSAKVTDKTPAPAAQEKGLVVSLDDPLTINLADRHYLRLSFALQLAAGQPAQVDMSTAVNLAVDSYSGLPVTALQAEDDRATIKQQLVDKIRTAYQGAVLDVYYTQFVTQ